MEVLDKFLGRVVVEIINPLLLLMTAAAFVIFVWGVFQFIRNAGDEGERETGRRAMGWGLIGLVIIFGAYGILNVALGTFNLNPVGPISR